MILPATELVEYSSATAMADTYKRCTDRMRELVKQMGEVCDELHNTFVKQGAHSYGFTVGLHYRSGNYDMDAEGIDRITRLLHREAWENLIDKLDIRKLMSENKQKMLAAQLEGRSEFYDQIKKETVELGPLPEITGDNIIQVLTGLIEQSGDMLAEKIVEEYRFWKPELRAQSGRYVTNQNNVNALGEKVIRGWMVERNNYGNVSWRPSYHNDGHLRAIDAIFHLLDGKGIPQEYDGQLITAIKMCDESGKGETPYFKFACFHNGNLHLKFKRKDLLAEFNRIAAEQVLPQPHTERRGTTAV